MDTERGAPPEADSGRCRCDDGHVAGATRGTTGSASASARDQNADRRAGESARTEAVRKTSRPDQSRAAAGGVMESTIRSLRPDVQVYDSGDTHWRGAVVVSVG